MTNCVFCGILTGDLPSSRVLDDDLVVAILDISPVNPGHTLVMPRRHVESFTDLTEPETKQIVFGAQRVAAALKREFVGRRGVTFSVADGTAAGQDVLHVHMHVIPRYAGDGFGWKRGGRNEKRTALDTVAAKIREILNATGKSG